MTDKELQDLMKLKRYEQPEEGYFDDFLTEFQQRQRTEMLKSSVQRSLLERIKAGFSLSQFTSGSRGTALKFGAGMACAAAVAVALTIHFLPKIQHQQQLAKHLNTLPTDIAETNSDAIMLHVREANTVSHEVAREQMRPIDFTQSEANIGPRFSTEQTVF